MRYRLLLLAGVILLALGTSCGAQPTAAPEAPKAEAPKAEEQVTVIWYVRSEPKEQPWEQDIVIPGFEKTHPNIKINLVITPWDDFDTKMQAMFAAGEGPDIWSHWGPSGFQDYRIRGLIQDLTPFIEKDKYDLSDFIPEVLDIYKVEGRVYGLPILTGASYLFYNKKLFDEAGLPHPPTDWDDESWTYDKFVEVAKKLTKDYDDPSKAIYGYHDGTWPNDTWPWLFGQDLYPADAYKTGFASKSYLDSEGAIKGIQAKADLTYKYKVSPSPAATEALSAGGNPFQTGRVAMQGIGVWGWWVHKGLEEQFPFGCAALPKGAPNAKAVIFTDPWMLSASTKHPNEAWEFLKYLVSPEVQRGHMKAVGAPPVRKSLLPEFFKLYPSMTPAEAEECFLGGVKHGQESPNHLLVRFDQLNNVVSAAIDPVNLGEKTASDTLPQANADLEKALQQIQSEYKK